MEDIKERTADEIRKIAQEELAKQIKENIDSALIFKYISMLEEENQNLTASLKRELEINTEYEKELHNQKVINSTIQNKKETLEKEIEKYEWAIKNIPLSKQQRIALIDILDNLKNKSNSEIVMGGMPYISISILHNDLEHMKNAKPEDAEQFYMQQGIIWYLEKLLEKGEKDK